MTSVLGLVGAVARAADEAAGFVQRGLSVHLVGLHGSGRSELLRMIADRLGDEGTSVLRLFGNSAWRREPFAVLVAAGVGPVGTPGSRRSAGEMSLVLAEKLRGRIVVVCDDADDLDAHTVGALKSVHDQQGLVAVTASRPQLPVRPDSLLLGLTPAVRLPAPALDVDEVHTICRALLGGPVAVRTLAHITTQAGGLGGLVHAMVTIGRATGSLQRRDGVWSVQGDLWTPHLAAAVEPYLAGVDQELCAAATTLALTGAITLEEAQRLVERSVLDRLLGLQLIHHSGGVIGVYPPLLAEYLRREGSPFARLQALDTALPVTDPAFSTSPGINRAVGVDAALRNQRIISRAAADVTLLRREWQADPTPDRAMPLLVAMRAAVEPAEQIEYVVATTAVEDSFGDARMRSWFATWLAVAQGRLTDALAALDEAAARLPDYRVFFEVTRAHVIFMRDRVPSLDTLADVPDSGDTELLRVLRIELLLAAGQTTPARELLSDFRPTGRAASAEAALLDALAAVLDGDLDDGVTQARWGYQHALADGDPGLQQAHAYTAVMGLGMAGRFGDATHLLSDALSTTTMASFRDVYHTGLLAVGASIARAQGRRAYAAALAAQAEAAGTGRGPHVGMDAAVLQARLDGTADLWPMVDDRIERGYHSAAIMLAVDAVERDADPARAAAIIQLGALMGGRLLPALAAYVAAAVSDDEAGLAAASSALNDTGALQYALRVDITRCLLLRRLGRLADAVQVADEAWGSSRVSGDGRSGLFWRLREDLGLSAREVEILSQLSSTATTSEVARVLHTSARTVENHLYNIGRKVGVSGREPLLRAARSWLHFGPV